MIYGLKSGYKNTYTWYQSKMKYEGQEQSTEVYMLKYYLWLSVSICISYGFDFPFFLFTFLIFPKKNFQNKNVSYL